MIWNVHTLSSAGVAIFYRRALTRQLGTLQVHEDGTVRGIEGWPGRILAVPMTWNTLKLVLVNVYAPNARIDAFLTSALPGLRDKFPHHHAILMGDFNFVHDPAIDRLRAPHVQLLGMSRKGDTVDWDAPVGGPLGPGSAHALFAG